VLVEDELGKEMINKEYEIKHALSLLF